MIDREHTRNAPIPRVQSNNTYIENDNYNNKEDGLLASWNNTEHVAASHTSTDTDASGGSAKHHVTAHVILDTEDRHGDKNQAQEEKDTNMNKNNTPITKEVRSDTNKIWDPK